MSAELSYAYTGRNDHDQIVKGTLVAGTEHAVMLRLQAMGLSPITITERSRGVGLNREIRLTTMTSAVGLKDLTIMSRQMATLTSAGLTLLRTLTILVQQTENRKLVAVLNAIRSDIERGVSVSEAFEKHDTVFPPLMINLVKAGEVGGFMEHAFTSIAETFESEAKLRETIKTALTYPAIVLAMATLAVTGMLIFIVPVFEEMFRGLGGELPVATQILVLLSRAMSWIGPIVLVLALAFTLWWRQARHTQRVRQVVDPIKLRLPVFGALLAKLAVARFSRNLSTMIAAGVPIMLSLKIVGETSGNWVVESALRRVQVSVSQGRSIAGPLAREPVFPSLVTQMVAVGEESGNLEQMLSKVADFYDQEVQATTEQLTALIEPLMISVIGVVIGGMVVALYLPMFDVFSYVQ